MTLNGWIVVGIVALFFGTISFMEVVDTTKPEIRVLPPGFESMHPEGTMNYSEVTYIYVLVRDLDSGIARVQWDVWQTGEPRQSYELQYAGWCFDFGTFEWHWGEDYLASGASWEIWALNITDSPITEEGQHDFWFKVYNGAGGYQEPTGMPNTFNIVPLIEGGEEEVPPPDDEDTGISGDLPNTGTSGTPTTQPTGYLELPILLFAIGAIAIVYGFTKKKVT